MDERQREWAYKLCECAGEDDIYAGKFWDELRSSDILQEFSYYMEHGSFLGGVKVAGFSVIDILIWQMDHFKSDLDRGLYDMQSNPDVMLLRAFETMLDMEKNPAPYLEKYSTDTGTDYPGKY